MTYQETIDYLYAIAPPFHEVGAKAYKPGLDTMMHLMQALLPACVPCDGSSVVTFPFPVIHIAGTNGKGSTSHLIASALAAAGKRVGLYTSPHLVSFCERMRVIQLSAISSQQSAYSFIPKQYVVDFVEHNKLLFEALQPSFFEITTAMAFCWLVEQKVDVAVIEVGLGGLLDATNIVSPCLTVITNIGMDHTDLLGHTLAEIAGQKAGIMKPGVPCVVGETNEQTRPVFLARARECNILGEGLETTACRLWLADECAFMRCQRLRYVPCCDLKGDYQQKNMQTAYVALQVLRNYTACDFQLTASAIRDGFAHVVTYTGLRGRWEVIARQPLTICDTGHNSHGVRTYIDQLKAYNKRLHIVFGMVADKDVDEVLRLLPEDAAYYFTQPESHRALPAAEMLARWQRLHPINHAQAYMSVDAALRAARTAATPDDLIFIGGSNYVVGEVLKNISANIG